jgi:hypothetical protein
LAGVAGATLPFLRAAGGMARPWLFAVRWRRCDGDAVADVAGRALARSHVAGREFTRSMP